MVEQNQNQGNNTNNQKNTQSQNTQNKVKKGKKVSIKAFMIGCLTFGLLLVGIVYGALYLAMSNTSVLESMGLGVDTVKNLLMVFTILFFGVIFLLAFSILVLNGYRLMSAKSGKTKYILGSIMGFVLLIVSITGGAITIYSVQDIEDNKQVVGNRVVSPYILTKNNMNGNFLDSFSSPIIAPVYMRFALNTDKFNSNIRPQMNGGSLQSLELDCGNGQTIEAGGSIFTENSYFPGKCLFLDKKEYQLKLNYSYLSNETQEIFSKSVNVGTINVDSKVSLNDGDFNLNDAKTSIVLGNAPANIEVNASTLFTDLLNQKNLKWDFDGGVQQGSVNNWDEENTLNTSFTYKKAGTYNVFINLPRFNTSYYLGEIKVLERNVPLCDLNLTKRGENKYLVKTSFDKSANISKYNFRVKDVVTNETIESIDRDVSTLPYTFDNGGQYKINLVFSTEEGKTGSCSTDTINATSGNYKVFYDTYLNGPSDEGFEKVNQSGDNINIKKIPSKIRLKVNRVLPKEDGIDVSFIDNQNEEILASSENTYEFEVSEEGLKTYKFEIKGDNGLNKTQEIDVNVEQKDLVAKLELEDDIGEEPFDVKLDASSSELRKEGDEIVYFSWDFDDGEKLDKTTQGQVTHTYNFNESANNGVYYPKITVETKDGLTDTSKTKVIVKRKQRTVDINMPSNPTQVTRKGRTTNFTLDTDGSVKSIRWDFDNGKTISGDGRRYMDVNTIYDESGSYNVKVTVEYENHPQVSETINIKVK